MWIRIKKKEEEFSAEPDVKKFDEYEQYVNLDKVEDVEIREKKMTFYFRADAEFTITPGDTTNFEEVKMLIEKGIAIEVADVYIQEEKK